GAPVDLFLSSDATITAADSLLGGLAPPPGPLNPGTCATLTGTVNASVPNGVYYIGAIADRSNLLVELIEDNNTATGNRVGVGNKPDLIVTQVSGPPSATGGASMAIAVTVCNQGTQPGSAPVDLLLSADSTITSADWWIGSL